MTTNTLIRKRIPEFPDYEIDETGTIYTARNGALRRFSRTMDGAPKITLYRDGIPYTRSLALLVAQVHLHNDHDPNVFNTPIHLNNDPMDCRVENLMWRPRWFALKYHRQYWLEEFRYATTELVDMETGTAYRGFVEPCQTFGLLYLDVIRSCTRGGPVMPYRNKEFRYAGEHGNTSQQIHAL